MRVFFLVHAAIISAALPSSLLASLFVAGPVSAGSPPTLVLARPEDQGRFRLTTFASGLSFPTSLAPLADGSLLVATSSGPSLFGSTSGSLLRLVDSDGDGRADGDPTPLAQGLPPLLTSVRRVEDLVVALSSGPGQETISLWRTGATPSTPLSPAGSLRFRFPEGSEHTTYALAARQAPSDPSSVEVFFNLGVRFNNAASNEPVLLEGDGSGVILPPVSLAPQSIQRLTLTPSGFGFQAVVQQIASGLRNAAGMIFAANGDLYLQDNGIDTPGNADVSLSADEINRIAAAELGTLVPDFGFPHTYISAATGETISGGTAVCSAICSTPGVRPPLLVFTPIGLERSEGAVELAAAPSGFPTDFAGGLFTSFFGMFRGGAANLENPLMFANPSTGSKFPFIPNQLLGHPNGLLASADSLFLTDLDYGGDLLGTTRGTIYQIQSLRADPPPVPGPLALAAPAGVWLWSRRLRGRRGLGSPRR